MKTKINVQSETAIEEALKRVNGNAGRHTFSASELEYDCRMLEERLEEAGIAKSCRSGCSAILLSGCKVPNSYTYNVNRNQAVVQRGPTGWFLTSVKRIEQRGNTGIADTPKIFMTQNALESMLRTKGLSMD